MRCKSDDIAICTALGRGPEARTSMSRSTRPSCILCIAYCTRSRSPASAPFPFLLACHNDTSLMYASRRFFQHMGLTSSQ